MIRVLRAPDLAKKKTMTKTTTKTKTMTKTMTKTNTFREHLQRATPHVLTAAPKFLIAFNVKSSSTLFADNII